MAADKKVRAGDRLEVPDPAVVVTPLGAEVRVVGGVYFAEMDGEHIVRPVGDES